jgi:hypothetical protein
LKGLLTLCQAAAPSAICPQGQEEGKMYVDTWASDDAAMWAKGPGPKGCSAAAAIVACAP